MIVAQEIFPVVYTVVLGWAALILFPRSKFTTAVVLVPTLVVAVLFTIVLADAFGSPNPPKQLPMTFNDWVATLQEHYAVVCTVAHFSVCDLWLGRWMTSDFWRNYTFGWSVIGRLLFTALLVLTYFTAPIGFLAYFLARFTILPRYVKTPQQARDEFKVPPVARVDPVLDKRVYAFDDNWPAPLRFLSRAIQMVLGLSCLVLMLVAHGIFALFALVLYYPLCYRRRAEPKVKRAPPRLSPRFLRLFTSYVRLQMLRVPDRYRFLPWRIVRYITQFAGFFEYMFNSKDPTLLFGDLEEEFGGVFPLCDGLGIADRETGLRIMQDPNVIKRPELVGWEVSKSQEKFCSITTIFLPSKPEERPLVANGRKLIHTWLANFPLDLEKAADGTMRVIARAENHAPNTPRPGLHRQSTISRSVGSDTCVDGIGAQLFIERLLPRITTHKLPTDQVYEYTGNLMFALMTGGAFKQYEKKTFVQAVSKSLIFLPSWFNFLLGGNYFERDGIAGYETIRGALGRYRGPKSALKKVFAQAAEMGIEDAEALRLLTVVFMIAGAVAPAKLAETVVTRLWEDEKWLPYFERDPVNFIKECARLDKAVPTVNMFSQEGWTLSKDKDGRLVLNTEPTKAEPWCEVPEGTPVHCSILNMNRDPNVFPDPDTFNPERKNLDQIVSWNGLETYLVKRELWSKAPRACPGHDISIKIVQYVAQRLKPDWHDSKQYKLMTNDLYNSYFGTLDLYTRLVLKLMQAAVTDWNINPPNAVDMVLPVEDHSLDLVKLDFNKFIPTYDEELPKGDDFKRVFGRWLVNLPVWPRVDNDAPWASRDDALRWRRRVFPDTPAPMVVYEELQSDEAMSRLAFYGMACHYTRPLDKEKDHPIPEGAVYVNDVRALEIFKVREPYQRYGAAAYFDKDFNIVGIYWSHARRVIMRGTGDEWRHAKYVWKASFFALVTIKDHLLVCHMTESNTLTTSTRAYLPLEHKLRVFLKPFTFHAVAINYQAAMSLINQRGLVNHIWAFEYDEFLRVCAFCYQSYRFKPLPEFVDRSMRALLPPLPTEEAPVGIVASERPALGRPASYPFSEAIAEKAEKDEAAAEQKYATRVLPSEEMKLAIDTIPTPSVGRAAHNLAAKYAAASGVDGGSPKQSPSEGKEREKQEDAKPVLTHGDFPFYQDAHEFFTVVKDYVTAYLKCTYPSDEEYHADADLHAFSEDLCKQLGISGVSSRVQLANVLAQLICNGTAVHQHVGQISDYMWDPTFIGCKILPNTQQQSVQTYTQVLALTVLTGLKMPRLMDDWAHLIRQGPGSNGFKYDSLKAYKKFRTDLSLLEQRIENRNINKNPENPAPRRHPFHSFNPQLIDVSVSV